VDWWDKGMSFVSNIAGVLVGAQLARRATQHAFEAQAARSAKQARLEAQRDAYEQFAAVVARHSVVPDEQPWGMPQKPHELELHESEWRRELAAVSGRIAHAFGSREFAHRAHESVHLLESARGQKQFYSRARDYCAQFENSMLDTITAFEVEMGTSPLLRPQVPARPDWCPPEVE